MLLPAIASSFFTALNFAYELTPAQILCTFPIALGVFTNLLWPGNKKVAAQRIHATPTAITIGSFLERLAFCSGVTVLLTISPLGNALSIGSFLTVFFLLFATHWAITLNSVVRHGKTS